LTTQEWIEQWKQHMLHTASQPHVQLRCHVSRKNKARTG
jgi:hypothetical protein